MTFLQIIQSAGMALWQWFNSPDGQEAVQELEQEISMRSHPLIDALLGRNRTPAVPAVPVIPGTNPVPPAAVVHPLANLLGEGLGQLLPILEGVMASPAALTAAEAAMALIPGAAPIVPVFASIIAILKSLKQASTPTTPPVAA